MKTFIVVIPARYGSKRLKGKPLIKIGGIPMIIRTYIQCSKVVNKKFIYIATDDKRIKDVADKYNANCILTSKNCLTGTDRVAEVSKKIAAKFYINVQGDEPFFNPNDLKSLILFARKNPTEIINGYTKIKDKHLFERSSIPKLIFDKNNYLLYMSRGLIPSNKKKKICDWMETGLCIFISEKSIRFFLKI